MLDIFSSYTFVEPTEDKPCVLDVNHLEHGDWVHCITDDINYQFGRTSRNPKCHYDISGRLNFNYDIEPILLTKQILQDSGFKKVDERAWNYPMAGVYFVIPDKEETNLVNYGYGFPFIACRYVHELQHMLYNSLKKEVEITINK